MPEKPTLKKKATHRWAVAIECPREADITTMLGDDHALEDHGHNGSQKFLVATRIIDLALIVRKVAKYYKVVLTQVDL